MNDFELNDSDREYMDDFKLNDSDREYIKTCIQDIKIPECVNEPAPLFFSDVAVGDKKELGECARTIWRPQLANFIRKFNNSINYNGYIYCYELTYISHTEVQNILKKSLSDLGIITKNVRYVNNEKFLTIFESKN